MLYICFTLTLPSESQNRRGGRRYLVISIEEGRGKYKCLEMLYVLGSYQNYQNGAVSNQLTDIRKGGQNGAGDSTVNLLICYRVVPYSM